MHRKFIITDDGVLRLGRASQHMDLLDWGEECTCGGGSGGLMTVVVWSFSTVAHSISVRLSLGV